MLTYTYTARDPSTGAKIKADVQAESEQAAAKLIKQQGYAPLEITPAVAESTGLLSRFTNHIRTKDKILFSRQLSTLINAGLPLVQSLRSTANQTKSKPLKVVVSKVINDVEAGMAFSQALAKHPGVFGEVYIGLISAGEVSGTLDKALERLADQQEKDAEILSKVRGAMVYPIIVLLVMVGVVTFMLLAVLPQVQELYKGLPGARLPFITSALLAVSAFTGKFWWAILGVMGVGVFLTTRWARTGPGKRVVDRLKIESIVIGQLFKKLYMARFARTSTTLVASGVPLLQVLSITAKSINNIHVEESINNAASKVKGGKALSDSLEGDRNFDELVPNMLRIGEQSGSVEDMLAKTADYFEKEVDNQIKTISTIIEPIMMILMGIMALLIVAAILLPIYGLVGQGVLN